MEKSENYYKRQEYMRELKIPTLTQIKNILGEDLGNAVIKECPEVLKYELGTEPKLHGAGDTLWTSPSDLLMGLVVLKPPFTNRYIKALTHEGILSIGMMIENKFRNEMEEKCKHALSEQEEMLVFIAEQECIKAVRDALADRLKSYEEKYEGFENEFEKRLNEEQELLTTRLLKDNEQVLQIQKEQMENAWQDKLLAEVEETIRRLTMKFLEDLDQQEFALSKKYSLELKKREAKHDAILELEQTICKETLKQLKHNLECKNISNLIYILCMERRKCEQNRLETEKIHNYMVTKLSTELEESEVVIEQLTDALSHEQERIVIRERCLKEILKQFQKFVYFALKAAPKQGEFLLNIEKLLLYELAETVVNLNQKAKPRFKAKRAATEQEVLMPQGLTLPEDHNCLDEIDFVDDSSEQLFSVIFNDKVYVREDFRNMVSQGIAIRPSNELWNRDVEQLIEKLKLSVEDGASGKYSKRYTPPRLPLLLPSTATGTSSVAPPFISIMVKTEPKNQSVNTEVDFSDEMSTRHDHDSRRSSVYFVDSTDPYHKVSALDNMEGLPLNQQMLTECLLESKLADAYKIAEVAQIHRNTSALLCAKDSIEHHRLSLRTGSIRDNVDEITYAIIKQAALAAKAQETEQVPSSHSYRNQNLPSSPILEKIKKMNEQGQEGTINVIEMKRSIEKVLSAILIDGGILEEGEMMKKTPATNVKDRKQQPPITPRERRYSGLSMAQDSLEMIKSKTLIRTEEMKQIFIEALDKTTPFAPPENFDSPTPSNLSKKDKISIMDEPMEIGTPPQYNSVDEEISVFYPLPHVYHTGSIVVNADQTWRVYEHQCKSNLEVDKTSVSPQERDNFINKENTAKVEGSNHEIKMCTKSFTVDRVHSILAMLKEDPSLMRIFTACSR